EWYLKKAEEVFLEIFERLYEKIYPSRKIKPKISIKKMKTRWGSCNKKLNRINLNLKLIHQPLVCIEYVITHELIHLMHPNHSKKFYNMLEVVMPDYKSKKKMLNSILVYI
ncbi:MAG: M48 family metallopeptidase, partial [bacterium]